MRAAIDGSGQSEMAEKILPKLKLMMMAFVEIRRNGIGVGQQWTVFPRPENAKALAATRQPGFEISAERIGEKQPDIGIGLAQSPEMQEVTRPGWRQGLEMVGQAPRLQQRKELFFPDQREFGVRSRFP